MQCVNQCFVPEYFSKPAICVLSSKKEKKKKNNKHCLNWSDFCIEMLSVIRYLSAAFNSIVIGVGEKVLKDFGTISICLQAPSAVIFDYIWIVIIAYQKQKKILFLTKTCKQD